MLVWCSHPPYVLDRIASLVDVVRHLDFWIQTTSNSQENGLAQQSYLSKRQRASYILYLGFRFDDMTDPAFTLY